MRRNVVAYALFAVIAILSLGDAAQPAGTACTRPRVRKSWEAYSSAEKTTYARAVSLAMQRGLQQKFVELHVEWFSEMEAHRTCMFIYWHRMYLLGYENMLRSLGKEFQCVTIPLWDHLAATARRATGVCSTVTDCSPIVRDFGGSQIGLAKSLIVYNVTIPRPRGGTCVNKSFLPSLCANNTGCARCIVRGPAHLTSYPVEADFGSVYQQTFSYSDWESFATSVERGVHNTMHGAVGGAMSYFQSPIDPLFYTHHAFIDALQAVYLKCQNKGETLLTAKQKGSDPRFWANCPRRSSGLFSSTSTITMRTRDYNGKWVDVRTNSRTMLYPYFKDLPATFSAYVDAKDLGVYSYTYSFSGGMSNMYTNCQRSNTMSAAVLLSDEDEPPTSDNTILRPVIRGATRNEDKVRRWMIAIFEAARLIGYNDEAARDQMEMILCVHKDECLGGVETYTDEFRKNFGVVGHPRCYTLLELIDSGDRIIGIPKWRQITAEFLPCPKPKTTTTVSMA